MVLIRKKMIHLFPGIDPLFSDILLLHFHSHRRHKKASISSSSEVCTLPLNNTVGQSSNWDIYLLSERKLGMKLITLSPMPDININFERYKIEVLLSKLDGREGILLSSTAP